MIQELQLELNKLSLSSSVRTRLRYLMYVQEDAQIMR